MLCNALNSADSAAPCSVNSPPFQTPMNMDSVVPLTCTNELRPTHARASTRTLKHLNLLIEYLVLSTAKMAQCSSGFLRIFFLLQQKSVYLETWFQCTSFLSTYLTQCDAVYCVCGPAGLCSSTCHNKAIPGAKCTVVIFCTVEAFTIFYPFVRNVVILQSVDIEEILN